MAHKRVPRSRKSKPVEKQWLRATGAAPARQKRTKKALRGPSRLDPAIWPTLTAGGKAGASQPAPPWSENRDPGDEIFKKWVLGAIEAGSVPKPGTRGWKLAQEAGWRPDAETVSRHLELLSQEREDREQDGLLEP